MNSEIDGQEKCPFTIYECCMSELIQQAIAHSNKHIENSLVHGFVSFYGCECVDFIADKRVQESRIEKSTLEKP